ncbi:MAG TPA: amidohydrolase [Chitinophagaceae bacterium]|jgi:amidohydrolase|nr:amidohydrolase [Chitinophagaceae bacterium]
MTNKTFFFLLLLCSTIAQSQNISSQIDQKATAIQSKLVEWRRYLHLHPELSNREYKTAEFVAEHLKSLGIEVKTGVAKTGVVGVLKGAKPGLVIALRADMDALPILERANVPFKSTVTAEYLGNTVPVMHACGHDSHVAMLLGTAEVLSSMKNELAGTVKFIFQPAEEGPPGDEEGGAPLMVKEGVMDNPKVDVIFGMHIESNIEIGRIEYKPGAFMASSDWFTIKVKGKGAHGSRPWAGVDPIAISSEIITGLQQIVSRQMELTKAPVVITVGKIHGGVRNNIIPEECILDGTIRTLDSKMQKEVWERIKTTATKIAEASGATAEVSISTKTLVTYNDTALVRMMIPSLVKATNGNLGPREWVTGSEDFSYYGEKAPAFFFYFGGMPKGNDPYKAPDHHTPDFYIDDSMLNVGVKAFCNLVFDYGNLKAKNTQSNKKSF